MSEIKTSNWGFPTPTWFGAGRVMDLAAALSSLKASNPLVVTDAGLAPLPVFHDLCTVLSKAGIRHDVYANVQPNPTGEDVVGGVALAKEQGHDAVVIMGGGSALDAGKAIAFMAGQSRPIWDFEDIGDNWTRGDTSALLPVIAIPTTAGTGSEFGRASVITNTEADTHRKVIVYHPTMMPEIVIMDPEVTIGLPPVLTAATGMDALSHALEAYCVDAYHPMSDGLSVQALKMIKNALPQAVANGADIEARSQMLVASGMACIALQKGLGGMHAISHALGAAYNAHHGMLNAVLMPHVLAFNHDVISGKLAQLAQDLQVGTEAEDFFAWLKSFRAALNIPDQLAQMGVEVQDVGTLAKIAAMDPCAGGNPKRLDAAAAAGILQAAR